MHRIGQGNRGGPTIWAIISSALLDTLRSKGFGTKMLSPISNMSICSVGYSFVDDTDIAQSNSERTPETTQKLQGAAATWEGGLKATGGALGPENSYWYLVSFTWSGGKWSYAPI
jgi:hypothetical protein